MFLVIFLFPFIFGAVLDRKTAVTKSKVENFIKFEYIFGGGKPRIKPIGCVPSNTETGQVLRIGDRFNDQDFVFSCKQDEHGVLSYDAVACIDGQGKEMSIGETRRLSNGTVILKCNMFGGSLKKIVEKAAGCYFNETIYGQDEQWIESFSKEQGLLSGKLMQCFRPHYSYYENHLIGCAIGKTGIWIGDYAQLSDKSFVRCIEETAGTVALKEASVEELGCELDNSTFTHGQEWDDAEKAARLHCSFGNVLKTGCLLNGHFSQIGQEVQLSNGCIFLCHPQSNAYFCEKKFGDFAVVDGS